jgi:hypothetical protein
MNNEELKNLIVNGKEATFDFPCQDGQIKYRALSFGEIASLQKIAARGTKGKGVAGKDGVEVEIDLEKQADAGSEVKHFLLSRGLSCDGVSFTPQDIMKLNQGSVKLDVDGLIWKICEVSGLAENPMFRNYKRAANPGLPFDGPGPGTPKPVDVGV